MKTTTLFITLIFISFLTFANDRLPWEVGLKKDNQSQYEIPQIFTLIITKKETSITQDEWIASAKKAYPTYESCFKEAELDEDKYMGCIEKRGSAISKNDAKEVFIYKRAKSIVEKCYRQSLTYEDLLVCFQNDAKTSNDIEITADLSKQIYLLSFCKTIPATHEKEIKFCQERAIHFKRYESMSSENNCLNDRSPAVSNPSRSFIKDEAPLPPMLMKSNPSKVGIK